MRELALGISFLITASHSSARADSLNAVTNADPRHHEIQKRFDQVLQDQLRARSLGAGQGQRPPTAAGSELRNTIRTEKERLLRDGEHKPPAGTGPQDWVHGTGHQLPTQETVHQPSTQETVHPPPIDPGHGGGQGGGHH